MISVLLAAAASAIIARLAGFGADVDDASLARAAVLGALLAIVVGPSLPRFPNPYEGQGALYDLLVALTRQAVLLAPLWLLLRDRDRPPADAAGACLLGFAIGFGFDLAGALLAVDSARAFTGIAILPPFSFPAARGSLAGYGAWTALAALAIALGRGRPALPIAVTVLVAFDQAASFTASPTSWLGQVGALTGRGNVAGLLALVALAASSAAALRKNEATTDPMRIATAAIGRVRAIAARWRQAASAARTRASHEDESANAGAPWVLRQNVQPILWIAAVMLIFVLPKLEAVAKAFWSLPILQARLGGTSLVLMDLPLLALLVGRVLLAGPRPGPDDDADAPAWHLERAITVLAMGLACALIAYPAIAAKPITSLASAVWGAAPQPPRATILLLLGAIATGLTLNRARRGLRAPMDVRRAGVIRHGAVMATALVLIALAQGVYPPLIVTLHASIGPVLKPLYFGLYNNHALAGFAVSNTLAVLAAVVTGGLSALAAAGLRRAADGAERFFVDASAAAGPSRQLA